MSKQEGDGEAERHEESQKDQDPQQHQQDHQPQEPLVLQACEDGGYMLQTKDGLQYQCTVAHTLQLDSAQQQLEMMPVNIKRKALPSFNRLMSRRTSSADDEEERSDKVKEDEDIKDEEIAAAGGSSNSKVYADLDAVPAAAATAFVPYTYYGPEGRPPPPPLPPPPPAAYTIFEPGEYAAASSEEIYMNYPGAAAAQQPPLPPPPGPSQPPPLAHRLTHSAATLILPPDPTMASPNDNHCILIQRVPQRNRKGKGRGEASLLVE